MKTSKMHRRRRKNLFKWFRRELFAMLTIYFFLAGTAWANPYGAQVVSGNVSFNNSGNTLNITNSPNSIINWKGFSINQNEITRFIQQSPTSAVLNRIVGQDPSAILGVLQSNGRVFLINPNGVLFGQGARIEVNGLVASTLNLTNQDFLSGKYKFTAGANPGSIKNKGTITTPAGGQVYLIAPDIENSGIINSPQGDVILAAGHRVQLVDSADPFISVVVSSPLDRAVNLGKIIASSGRIGIYGGLIRQSGIVNADSAIVGEGGKIIFKATKDATLDAGSITSASGPQGGTIIIQSESGTTLVSGTVTAAGNDGTGGNIHILGNHVGLIDNAQIDASGKTGGGIILIGGDYQGKNPVVQNAEATYVGKDATIKADAIANGDGGKVIVWSDKATRVYGAISAKGGSQAGNGGFVETSGGFLDVTRTVDLSAPAGKGGTWLLDPNNITITDSGSDTNVAGSPNFTTTDDSATITPTSIQTALNLGTNVSITTGSSGTNSEAGNISINSSITKTGGGDTALTLSAHNNININQSVTSSSGKLNLTVIADSDTTGGGATNIYADINTNGGGLTATGGSGTVNLIGGTVTLDGASSTKNLNMSGGVLAGSGALTLLGASTWTGGTISVGGSGGVTVPSSATLTLSGNNDKILGGGNLTIAGQAGWVGLGNLRLDSAGQFTIQSGGLFDIRTDADIHYTAGGVPTFTNAGILRKSAGTDVTVIGASIPFNFVNSGTLDAQTGILNFVGNNTFNNGSTFTGAGINRITTGAAFSGAITSANLDLAGGTFSGTATLSGATNWSGGTIGGNAVLTIPSGSALNMVNSGDVTLSNATLIDQGTITWTGAGNLHLNSAGQFTIQSGGLFDIKTDADIHYTAGGVPTLTNAGILRKSAGSDVTVIGASTALAFNNTGGAIDVTAGSLQLNAAASFSGSSFITGGTVQFTSGGGSITGSLNIGSGATMDFASGTTSFTGTTDFTGSGSLLLSGATWSGSGNVNVSSPMTWTGGTISVGGSGGVTVPSSATLTLSGNNDKILGGGNLTIAGQAGWVGLGNLRLDSAGQFTIQSGGLFDIRTDADIHYTAGGVPTFTNAGILRKSAGTDVTVIGASIPFNFVNSGTLDAQTGILNFVGNNTFNNGSTFTGAGINRITTGAAFSGAITSANLDLAGGTFSGTATLSGATNWSGGTIGGNAVLTIPSGSALNMVNSGDVTLSNATLIDQGTITWTGAGNLHLNSAGQFTIQSGGLFDIKTDADIHYTAGGVPTLTNAGILRKSAGSDVTVIGASTALAFNNTGGAIDVTAGSLQLNAAASFSGSSFITGGTVQFTSGGGSITGSLNIGSGATMDFASGTTSFTGTTDFTGSGSLLLSGATWSGSGNVNVSSPMTWTGGTISVGGSGGVTVPSSATLTLSGNNDKILGGGNLTIAGQAGWVGLGNLRLDSAGQFTIQSGGLFDIRTDADIHYTAGGVPTFTNAGILRKSAGTDVTVIGASIPFNFVNSGTLDAQTGILNFVGNNTFNNGSTFTGAGINRITTGAAFSGAITSANLDLAGGTFSGTATLSGATNWSGGTIGGNAVLTIPSGSALNMVNSGDVTLSNATLIDQGTITWTGAGNLHLNSAGQFTIQSGGLFDIKTDADIHYTAGGVPTLTNAGILRKSAGSDVTVIGASGVFSVNNSGVIDVSTGTIEVTGTFSSSGTIETASGTTFSHSGGFSNDGTIGGKGTINVGAGNTLTNNGTINPGGAGTVGTLSITGNLVQGSSGIINIDIAGTTPGTQYDQLAVSGSASLDGTLNIAHVSGYTPSGGETFNVINSAGNTGSFATINPPAPFTYTAVYGATVLSLAFGSGSGTDTWLLNADGSWDVPGNWSLGRAPLPTDLVVINGINPGSYTITVSGNADAKRINSNENLTIGGGSLSLAAGANASLFGSNTTLSLTSGGALSIGTGATLTAYNLFLASGNISGPGSLTVTNGFTQNSGGTIGATTPVSSLTITQASGNLMINDLLKASGNISLTADNLQVNGPVQSPLMQIQPRTYAAITLGVNAESTLSLLQSDLDNLTIGELQVFAPGLTVESGLAATPVTLAHVDTLQLGTQVAVNSPLTMSMADSTLFLNANKIDINAAVTAGAGGVFLGRNSSNAGYLIGVASKTYPANTVELTNAELRRISTTGPVVIGDPYNAHNAGVLGAMQLVGPIDLTGITNQLRLVGNSITEVTGATITVPQLAADSYGSISLTEANHVSTFAAKTDLGSISFANQGSLTIGRVATTASPTNFSTDGVTTSTGAGGGSVTIVAHSPLTIDNTGSVAAYGDITLEAAASGSGDNLTINGPVTSTGGSITLRAGNSIFENAAINALNGIIRQQDMNGGGHTLLFTADDKTKTYGDANDFSSTITGYVQGDTAASAFTGLPAYSLFSENVGTWAITVSQGTLASARYNFTFAPGLMTISKALLTITAPSATKIYDGTTTVAATPTISGLRFSDTVTGFVAAYSDKNAGTGKTISVTGYTVNDGNGGGNYNVTVLNSDAGVINKALLTIAAVSNTKNYDGTTSAATPPTSMGLQAGDTITGLTEAYTDKNAGTNKTIRLGSGFVVNDGNSGNNYNVSTISEATGVINKVSLTITADDKTRIYGDANPAFTGSITGFVGSETLATSGVAGSANFTTTATAASNAGNYHITPDASTLTAGNYSFDFLVNGNLTINKAPLIVTANDTTRIYGNPNPAFTALYSGYKLGQDYSVLSGSLSFDTPATSLSPPGNYRITPGGLASANYQIAFVDGIMLVQPAQSTVQQQQNALFVSVNNAGGTVTETPIFMGQAGNKNEDKDKQSGGQTAQEGQNSETQKQSLPYCN